MLQSWSLSGFSKKSALGLKLKNTETNVESIAAGAYRVRKIFKLLHGDYYEQFLRSFTLLAFAASIAGNIAAIGTIYDGDDDLSAGRLATKILLQLRRLFG